MAGERAPHLIKFVVVLQPNGLGHPPRSIERTIWAPNIEAARETAREFGALTATRYVESRSQYDLGMPRPLSSGQCLGCGREPRIAQQLYGERCITNYRRGNAAGYAQQRGPKPQVVTP